MKNFNKIKRILKIRPLTPREKAVLCCWDKLGGKFTKTDKSDKMSEILLSYKNVFEENEIKALVEPLFSDEFDEFCDWMDLIDFTSEYDLKSLIFFNKFISLFNERSFFLYRPEKDFSKKYYSLTLDEEINIFQINDEITKSLFMFYRFLICIITNNVLLSNAFIASKDLLSIKSLIQFTKITKKLYKNETDGYLTRLISVFKEEKNDMIIDHLNFIKKHFNSIRLRLLDESMVKKINEGVERCLEKFYPSKNVSPNNKIPKLFDNV